MEQSLGVSTDSFNTSLNLDTSVKDRNSDLRLKGDVADLQPNEEKRKEFIMAKLLETERSYVKVNIKDTSSEYLLLIISKSKKQLWEVILLSQLYKRKTPTRIFKRINFQ